MSSVKLETFWVPCYKFLPLYLCLDTINQILLFYLVLNFIVLKVKILIDVCAPTTQEVKQKINSILENLPVLYGQNVLVQFWGPAENGNTCVLATTCQPAAIYGNNQELESYHEVCLHHKLYVHVYANPQKKPVAVGLPGRIFVTCTPEWTNDMHDYPEDQRPLGPDAIFNRKWGSFGVPLFVEDQCVGVLEFVTDKLKDSYDTDIDSVCQALEYAGLQTSTKNEHPQTTTNIVCGKRIRKTKSSGFTNYHDLAQKFGLSKSVAAAKLGLKESTFRNVRILVGIPEWPCLPNATWRASSPQGTQTSSSDANIFGNLPNIVNLPDIDSSDLMDQGNYEASGPEDIDMVDTLYICDLESFFPPWNSN